jgi:hypothetical protein
MAAPHAITVPSTARRTRIWLGVVLLAAGLAGHLLAAHALGGYFIAYRDHIGGFCIILLVTGAVIAGLGWRFWRRGRFDTMLLVIGAVQALFGLWIWLNRFNIR